LSGLLAAAAAHAEDWPQFRGPDGQGHSNARNVPVHWSSTSNVAWKAPVPGLGWSSPVLSAGRIYLTTAVAAGGNLSLRALCMEAESGRMTWNVEVFSGSAGSVHNKNSHASPTPLPDGGRVYVHFGPQGTACLDLSGKILWRNNELKYPPVHGSGGSPILVDNTLIFSCDGASNPFVVALDARTGKILWKTARETDASRTFSFSTPLLISVNGAKQVISAGSNVVCAYDPNTGREIWRVRYDGYSVVPRPVYGHGLVYLSTGFDHPVLLAVRPDGIGDVTDTHVSWKCSRSAPNTPSPLLSGNELYMVADSGVASCLDALTGRVHWQERVGGGCSASPVLAEGRIYIQTEDGTGVVLAASREFQKIASNAMGERSLASYAVGDGALFIRTAQNLYRIQ
jgi:outer membrane protein assembly factor BamB